MGEQTFEFELLTCINMWNKILKNMKKNVEISVASHCKFRALHLKQQTSSKPLTASVRAFKGLKT